MSDPLPKLQADRDALLQTLAATGDMRRGSITEVFRSCGKPTCACACAEHPGHGPYHAFTTKVGGKTRTLQLRPGPMLSKIEREVETYRGFRATCDRLLEVNQAICEARPVEVLEPERKRRSPPRSGPRSSPKSTRS